VIVCQVGHSLRLPQPCCQRNGPSFWPNFMKYHPLYRSQVLEGGHNSDNDVRKITVTGACSCLLMLCRIHSYVCFLTPMSGAWTYNPLTAMTQHSDRRLPLNAGGCQAQSALLTAPAAPAPLQACHGPPSPGCFNRGQLPGSCCSRCCQQCMRLSWAWHGTGSRRHCHLSTRQTGRYASIARWSCWQADMPRTQAN
jgi:hypothetical protein